jgi:hypothetical protein
MEPVSGKKSEKNQTDRGCLVMVEEVTDFVDIAKSSNNSLG